jgi:hypothetical protein
MSFLVTYITNHFQAIIGKALINSFYGQPQAYSYWSGCPQGICQGFMLAQRYPNAYDGITAAAPALKRVEFVPASSRAQIVMNLMGEFPRAYELNAITEAAISSCDSSDGLIDGLVSDPDVCKFDPISLVDHSINCTETGSIIQISAAAAIVANATWTGPRTADGGLLWYGIESQTGLTESTSGLGYAMTSCANYTCMGVPTGLGEPWLTFFVKKNPARDYTKIYSVEEYASLFHASVQEFDSLIGTSDPDLSSFQAAGGKLITYHGLVSLFNTNSAK